MGNILLANVSGIDVPRATTDIPTQYNNKLIRIQEK
jgi:hypothetical protein